MTNIVKRRKTTKYAQIHNSPLQTLKDLRAIGLIAHLMSLPENWEIKKLQLYSKFGRAAVTNAIKELEEKKYWVDIKYRCGKQNHHIYHISDIPFTEEEVKELIIDVLEEYPVMQVSKPFEAVLTKIQEEKAEQEEKEQEEKEQEEKEEQEEQREIKDSSSVDFEQLKFNCSSSTVENRHLSKERTKKKTGTKETGNKRNIVTNLLTKEDTINNLISEYMEKGLTKELCYKVLAEVEDQEGIENFGGYFRTCLNTALKNTTKKILRAKKDNAKKPQAKVEKKPEWFDNRKKNKKELTEEEKLKFAKAKEEILKKLSSNK